MAAIAHLGVGFAAKRIAPEIPVGYLLLGSEVLDLLWFGFYFAGIKQHPAQGFLYANVWTHSLLMATIWSGLFGVIAARIGCSTHTGVIFGLVVFSHWVVDFITHPMTAIVPTDTGVPLGFYGSPLVGLGMYRTKLGAYAGDLGTLALGIIVYVFARRRLKRLRAQAAVA